MTLNLWNTNQWAERRHTVVQCIEEIAPDLVALQEVVRSPSDCQATWIAERCGMTAVFGPAAARVDGQFGNAVLTRLPILSSRTLALTDGGTGNERRALLTVQVTGRDGPISFSSTHLSHLFNEGWVREAQVVQIADALPALDGGFPVILCGDLNARPDSNEVRFLKGLATIEGRSTHLFDAFEVANPAQDGSTWDNRNPYAAQNEVPDQRIDYVLVGVRNEHGAGRVLGADLTGHRPIDGRWASDHFGVWARLSLGTAPIAGAEGGFPVSRPSGRDGIPPLETIAAEPPDAGAVGMDHTEFERPQLTLDDVAGLADVKAVLDGKVFAPTQERRGRAA